MLLQPVPFLEEALDEDDLPRARVGSRFHYVERRTNDRVGVDPEVPV